MIILFIANDEFWTTEVWRHLPYSFQQVLNNLLQLNYYRVSLSALVDDHCQIEQTPGSHGLLICYGDDP